MVGQSLGLKQLSHCRAFTFFGATVMRLSGYLVGLMIQGGDHDFTTSVAALNAPFKFYAVDGKPSFLGFIKLNDKPLNDYGLKVHRFKSE